MIKVVAVTQKQIEDRIRDLETHLDADRQVKSQKSKLWLDQNQRFRLELKKLKQKLNDVKTNAKRKLGDK